MPNKIQIRRDTSANWISVNPVLGYGEPGLETDTNDIKFGDGVTEWINLQYWEGSINGNIDGGGSEAIYSSDDILDGGYSDE